jgi:hypothetical protein
MGRILGPICPLVTQTHCMGARSYEARLATPRLVEKFESIQDVANQCCVMSPVSKPTDRNDRDRNGWDFGALRDEA